MVTMKTEQIGYILERNSLESIVPANGVKDQQHQHQGVGSWTEIMFSTQPSDAERDAQNGEVLRPPNAAGVRSNRANRENQCVGYEK